MLKYWIMLLWSTNKKKRSDDLLEKIGQISQTTVLLPILNKSEVWNTVRIENLERLVHRSTFKKMQQPVSLDLVSPSPAALIVSPDQWGKFQLTFSFKRFFTGFSKFYGFLKLEVFSLFAFEDGQLYICPDGKSLERSRWERTQFREFSILENKKK